MRGQYEQAKGMCYKLLKKYPECNRTAFNAGWFKLSEGKVKEGYLKKNIQQERSLVIIPQFITKDYSC